MKRILTIVAFAGILISCQTKNKMETDKISIKDDIKALLIEPKHYVCYRTPEAIEIDGKLDKAAWAKAQWTDLFVDIEGDKKPLPTQNTKVKMLWDTKYLYVAAQLDEEHIWAYLEHKDDVVYHDNDFEIFIDPDNDAKNYFEFEINARQTVFDLFMPFPYRHSTFALHNWDFKGIKYAVHIDGTLNNGNDKDRMWTVEIAIPFSDVSFGLDNGRPNPDKLWRINFSRVQWDTRWENGKYVKLTDKDGKTLPEHNWVWSPVGAISMHMPERYGYLKFSTQQAGEGKEDFVLPNEEKLKRVLWAVFYREEAYHEKNKKFTANISELGNDLLSLFDQKLYKLNITVGETLYEAKLQSTDGKVKMYITNEGIVKGV